MNKQSLTEKFMGQDDTFWGVEVHEDYSEFTGLGFHGCQCTGFAVRIQEKLGAERVKVMGFHLEDNPQAGVGSICDGHDFAVVDGRYIVDPWLVEVETGNITTHKGTKLSLNGQGVFDLETEAELVADVYGNKEYWNEMGSSTVPCCPPEESENAAWWKEFVAAVKRAFMLDEVEVIDKKESYIEDHKSGMSIEEILEFIEEKYGLDRFDRDNGCWL